MPTKKRRFEELDSSSTKVEVKKARFYFTIYEWNWNCQQGMVFSEQMQIADGWEDLPVNSKRRACADTAVQVTVNFLAKLGYGSSIQDLENSSTLYEYKGEGPNDLLHVSTSLQTLVGKSPDHIGNKVCRSSPPIHLPLASSRADTRYFVYVIPPLPAPKKKKNRKKTTKKRRVASTPDLTNTDILNGEAGPSAVVYG